MVLEKIQWNKERKETTYDPALAGFPATESAKMIDILFQDIIPRALATGRLKPNDDMSLAIELVADFKSTIDAKGGVELWAKISETGNRLILEGEIEEDIQKINRGEKMVSRIDGNLWEEYLVLSNKVIQTTLVAMGSSSSGPQRLDTIMEGFTKNFSVNMAVAKKGGYGDNEVLDLRES